MIITIYIMMRLIVHSDRHVYLQALRDDAELRRKQEIHEAEESKNAHIQDLMKKHEKVLLLLGTSVGSVALHKHEACLLIYILLLLAHESKLCLPV